MRKICVSLFAGIIWVLILSRTVCAQTGEHVTRLEMSHGKPFVTVMVNGQGPFRFVIDTGTGGEAFVTPQLARQLGLQQIGQTRLTDPSGKGGHKVPSVLMHSLTVAGVEFADVKAAVHDLGDADGPCQGLLGFLLFRDYLLKLDYPNHRMEISSGELELDGEKTVLPFRMPDGIPIVSLALGSTRVDALIDSGGTGLSLPETVAAQFQFSSSPLKFSDSQSISTRFQVRAAHLLGDVHLGNYIFDSPFIELNPAFPLANFGSCPMQNFTITFDQKQGRVRFEAMHRVIHLAATPGPVHLENAKRERSVDLTLIPVG